MHEAWEPLGPYEVVARFSELDVDWWIAGGVAIDLFLGWESRPHADLDIEMFRVDREALFDAFAGWDLHSVSEGALHPWGRGQDLSTGVFGIWGRPSEAEPWRIEVMLADGDGSEWRFRRDPTISLPRSALTRTTSDGLPYCAPEVQLLYKAKQARPKDDLDLARALHLMTETQKAWLRSALTVTSPDHPWIEVLEHSMSGR